MKKHVVPTDKLSLSKLSHFLATGFGSGFFFKIPGTVGSVVAILAWYPLAVLSRTFYYLVITCSVLVGIYFCEKTSRDIKQHDHSCIVWDEFIGIWITLTSISINNWRWVLVGFFLFRLLDIWKPWPIGWLDRNIGGGIGIIIDDVIAGIIAYILIFLVKKYCCIV